MYLNLKVKNYIYIYALSHLEYNSHPYGSGIFSLGIKAVLSDICKIDTYLPV